MARIAVVAADEDFHSALAAVADAGVVELESASESTGEAAEALLRLEQAGVPGAGPRLQAPAPDLAELERAGRRDLLQGEVELEQRLRAAVGHAGCGAALGWTPAAEVPRLQARLAGTGAAVLELAPPPGQDPPTLLRPPRVARPFEPLVTTYGVVRSADLDPTTFAGIAFVLMFGMMFGDLGHGLIVLLAALLLRWGRPSWLASFRRAWPVVAACGASACAFGILYGEAFGPTGLLPAVWLAPLRSPLELLAAGVIAGLVLLGISHVFGAVNRWREGGPGAALYATSGIAGLLLFGGLAAAAAGILLGPRQLAWAGGALAVTAVVLLLAGFLYQAGRGATGVLQAVIETFDAVIRLVSNSTSFARLAAFGVVHAAIGTIVWQGTLALAHGVLYAAAVLLFVTGNLVAFALEGLVAAIQALRLEYYELFSRIFGGEGRPFAPWHIPLTPLEDTT